jgi:hypothetical protein
MICPYCFGSMRLTIEKLVPPIYILTCISCGAYHRQGSTIQEEWVKPHPPKGEGDGTDTNG